MSLVRQFYNMKIRFDGQAPATPDWPQGIEQRTYQHPEDLEAVVEADYEAFRDHWGFVEQPLAEEVAYWRHFTESDPFFDSRYWFLAVDGEEVAGVAICAPVAPDGEEYAHIRSLAVRRPWRRQGLATALLLHAFGLAYQDGKAGVALGVDAENLSGAMRLYTRAGMLPSKVNHVYETVIRDGVSLSNEG
jgi:mycothiol synthase